MHSFFKLLIKKYLASFEWEMIDLPRTLLVQGLEVIIVTESREHLKTKN